MGTNRDNVGFTDFRLLAGDLIQVLPMAVYSFRCRKHDASIFGTMLRLCPILLNQENL
jgi:hypothetical protein